MFITSINFSYKISTSCTVALPAFFCKSTCIAIKFSYMLRTTRSCILIGSALHWSICRLDLRLWYMQYSTFNSCIYNIGMCSSFKCIFTSCNDIKSKLKKKKPKLTKALLGVVWIKSLCLVCIAIVIVWTDVGFENYDNPPSSQVYLRSWKL